MGKKSKKGQQHHAAHVHHKAGEGTHGHHHFHSGAWYNAHHKDRGHHVDATAVNESNGDSIQAPIINNNDPPEAVNVETTTKDLQEPLLSNEEPETEMTPNADRGIGIITNDEKKTSDDPEGAGINHYHGYTVNGGEIAAINDHYVTDNDETEGSGDGVCGCFEKCTIM